MSKTVVVRYTTHPEAAEENVRLIEGVFAALAELEPPGFRYTTLPARRRRQLRPRGDGLRCGEPAADAAGVRRVSA